MVDTNLKKMKKKIWSQYNTISHYHCVFCCLPHEITPFIIHYMAHAVMSELNSYRVYLNEAKKKRANKRVNNKTNYEYLLRVSAREKMEYKPQTIQFDS